MYIKKFKLLRYEVEKGAHHIEKWFPKKYMLPST